MLTDEESNAAEKLADDLGVKIREHWHIALWSLPLLQKIASELAELKNRVAALEEVSER